MAKQNGYTMQEICMTFLARNRFYCTLLAKINKIPYPGIPTAGVAFNKFGKPCLFYNPDFVASLPLAEAQGLVEHELLHIFWRHLIRFKMESTSEKMKKGASLKEVVNTAHQNRVNNLGTDSAINQYIKDLPTLQATDQAVIAGLAKVGDNMGVYPETYNLPRDENADFYIEEIGKQLQPPPACPTCGGSGKVEKSDDEGDDKGSSASGGDDGDEGDDDSQGGGQGDEQGEEQCPECGGSGLDHSQDGDGGNQPLDDHSMWGKVVDVDGETGEAKISEVSEHDIDPEFEVQNIVMKAIEECKDFGNLPAHIAREIERLQEKPRHNWKQTLRVFINSVLTVSKKLSQKRVNKRFTMFDYILPGKKKAKRPRVAYIRDTSGSMFNDEVQAEIANELTQVAKRADVFVLDADTQVQKQENGQYHYKFKKQSDLKPYLGGGGTCFLDAFDKAKALGVDAVIYATDTYGSFPNQNEIGKLGKATIWLTFGQDDVNIPFGRHVNINPQDFE